VGSVPAFRRLYVFTATQVGRVLALSLGSPGRPDLPPDRRRPAQFAQLAGPTPRDGQPRLRWRLPGRRQRRACQRHARDARDRHQSIQGPYSSGPLERFLHHLDATVVDRAARLTNKTRARRTAATVARPRATVGPTTQSAPKGSASTCSSVAAVFSDPPRFLARHRWRSFLALPDLGGGGVPDITQGSQPPVIPQCLRLVAHWECGDLAHSGVEALIGSGCLLGKENLRQLDSEFTLRAEQVSGNIEGELGCRLNVKHVGEARNL
jgi:hypothetical protein